MLSQGSNKDEATNKLLSLVLLSCYNHITIYQADDLNKIKNYQKISSLDQENKDLLSLERWDNIFKSGDKELLNQEIASLQDALSEIKSEDLNFDEMRTGPRDGGQA